MKNYAVIKLLAETYRASNDNSDAAHPNVAKAMLTLMLEDIREASAPNHRCETIKRETFLKCDGWAVRM